MTERMFLKRGAHKTLEDGACAMELTAWLAGEPHTDKPLCVSPVIAAFVRQLNDRLSDDARQALLPYCIRVIGTRTTLEVEVQRGFLAADWGVRVAAPARLDAFGRQQWANELRGLLPIVARASARTARETTNRVKAAATYDAYDAAYDAAAAAAAAADAAYDAVADAAYATDHAAAAAAAAAYVTDDAILLKALVLLDCMIALSDDAPTECVAERVVKYTEVLSEAPNTLAGAIA